MSLILIETKDLLIRRFKESDAKELYDNHNDKEFIQWFPEERFESINEAYEAINFFNQSIDHSRLPFVVGIELKKTGELIGDTGVSEVDNRDGEIEVGFSISSKYRKSGYATQAVKAITNYIYLVMSKLGAIKLQLEKNKDIVCISVYDRVPPQNYTERMHLNVFRYYHTKYTGNRQVFREIIKRVDYL